MEGVRVFGMPFHLFRSGEYGYCGDVLYGCCPNGLIANLGNHRIIEHDNGTITVTPSIKCGDGTKIWHGYLTKGVWVESI